MRARARSVLRDPRTLQQSANCTFKLTSPQGGGEAHDHYPFPQIMDPDGVAGLVASGEVVWVVSQAAGGTMVGSAAAVRNIGDVNDRIAEVFGIVVDVQRRYRGTGSALLRRIVEELSHSADFILCEARTAAAGRWRFRC